MNRTEIDKIIEKYKRMSEQIRRFGDEKCAYFERVAAQIEDDIYIYEDDSFETEQDIIDDVKETFEDFEDFYDDEDYENMDMLDE